MLIHEILQYTASRLPDKVFLAEDERELTYSQTWAQARAVAAGLQQGGVEAGDRVALLFPNSIDFCLCCFGVLMLGAVVVPVNNRLAPKEMAYVLEDSGPKVLMVHEQFQEAVAEVAQVMDLPGRVIGADSRAYGSVRVMGTAFATGEAAGSAAALSASTGETPSAEAVRAMLKEHGALI